jgi:acyl-CoA dehydrogenase
LSRILFHDYRPVFAAWELPNVALFTEQTAVFAEMLMQATPAESQLSDVDYLLALGEIFTLVVYGQLFLENAAIYEIGDDLVDQVFDVLVRDFSRFAVQLHGKPTTSKDQAEYCLRMIRRPEPNPALFERVWTGHVHALRDAYTMTP